MISTMMRENFILFLLLLFSRHNGFLKSRFEGGQEGGRVTVEMQYYFENPAMPYYFFIIARYRRRARGRARHCTKSVETKNPADKALL
jgi:hypothetical protein